MRIGALVDATSADMTRAVETCHQAGIPLVGAVQARAPGGAIVLRLLPDGPAVAITEDRGTGAAGCRLDPDALARAVAAADRALAAAIDAGTPAVLVVNRFGKTEAAGRGFRDTIASAVGAGMPVLVLVPAAQEAAFAAFVGASAESPGPDPAAVLDWCRSALAACDPAAPAG